MRNFDSLLDDFQDKVGAERVTEDFRARRQEASSLLKVSSPGSDLDEEIEGLVRDEADAQSALEEAQRKAAERLASLREDRDRRAKQLREEKERLKEMENSRQSRTFFTRVLRTGPSTEAAKERVAELETKLAGVEAEIERSRKKGRSAGGEDGLLEIEQRLESARNKLAETQTARRERSQLTKEREIAAQAISSAIATMKLDETPSGEQAPQAA